eukprot:scaffold5504_cov101-Isochrysis_galbana.AAC.11
MCIHVRRNKIPRTRLNERWRLSHPRFFFISILSLGSVKDRPITGGSRKRDKLKTITDANAPWGHSGNLKKGTSPEGKGR